MKDNIAFGIYALMIVFIASMLASIPAATAAPTLQTDQGQALALEDTLNQIRTSLGRLPRTNSSKLRTEARSWNVIYTPLATYTNADTTFLSNLILETVHAAEFDALVIYYAVFDAPGQHSASSIAHYWLGSVEAPYIFYTPEHKYQGCAYRFVRNHTRAFCIFGSLKDDVLPSFTATPRMLPSPTPFRR